MSDGTDSTSGPTGISAKQAEDDLAKSERRFRLLVESSPNAVVLAAADGTISLVNRQAEVAFGYQRDELIGKPVEMLVPQRFRPGHPALRAEFMADPRQRPMGVGRDLFAVRKDGFEMPVEIGLTPIEMPEGLCTMATITDITLRKRAEEELRRTAAALARSNEELEQFAHVASHDLQEPLRVVRQHVEFVQHRLDKALDEDTRQSMDLAVDAAARMQALIRDLLAYALLGREGRAFAQTDMNAIVGMAMGNLAARIEETGASIRHDSLPGLMADGRLMAQLMQNLLGNAIKFCAKGRVPAVRIGARREERSWLIFVEDNGIGIEPEHAERIFKMFYRLNPASEYAGTGIGLAICKKIVQYHGGRIWVETRPEQGSTFFFSIPDQP
jgi:PAS domain S-box-containing protein